MDYVNQMEFYLNAYRIAFAIAGFALVLAVILFFAFDIRTIFLIKTGFAQRKTVQEMGERNAKTGQLRVDPAKKTGANTKARTTRKTKRGTQEVLDSTSGVQKSGSSSEHVHKDVGTTPLFDNYKADVSENVVKENSSDYFRVIQKTIITHTDEKVAI